MGGGLGPNFQLLMLSTNLLKSQIPDRVQEEGSAPIFYFQGGGVDKQLSTFDADIW